MNLDTGFVAEELQQGLLYARGQDHLVEIGQCEKRRRDMEGKGRNCPFC